METLAEFILGPGFVRYTHYISLHINHMIRSVEYGKRLPVIYLGVERSPTPIDQSMGQMVQWDVPLRRRQDN